MNAMTTRGFRLEGATDLLPAIERLAEENGYSFCDVSGFGALDWVELSAAEGAPKTRVTGPLLLLGLRGRFRRAGPLQLADFFCTVSRQTDAGIQVLGGKIQRAQASFAEIALHPLDAERAQPAAAEAPRKPPSPAETTRLAPQPSAPVLAAPLPYRPPAPAAEPAKHANGTERWADVIAESRRMERMAEESGLDGEDDNDADHRPNRGDIVLHKQFGRCSVARMGDTHITLRKPDGRAIQLGLAVLKFVPEGKEGNADVYRVEVMPLRR